MSETARGGDERGVLDGVRVVDLSSGICGPYVTKLLADAGADVVKVEGPAGDPARRFRALDAEVPEGEDGAFFRFLNTSKRSVVLDLSQEDGRSRLAELARGASLLVEDLGPGRLEACGVSLDALRTRTPELSVLSISAFGSVGPYSTRPANEFTLQSWVGSTHGRGLPGEEPMSVGGRLGEFLAAAFAASGALAALRHGERTGQGQHIDFSMLEAMLLAFQQYRFIFKAFDPTFQVAREVEIPSIEPASDGFIGLATITGQQFQDFCVMIERPELGQDPELASFQGRMAQRERVWKEIRSYTTQHTVDELLERALLFRIPSAPVLAGRQVPDIDHFAERGVFVENPAGFLQPRVPYRLSAVAPARFRPAPSLGADAPRDGAPARPRTAALAQDGAERPLEGLRVIDLTAFLAGPIASTQLGAFGADVIKVESTKRPDMMRFSSGFVREELWEWSPIYHGANPGKRGITLDLDAPEGMALLKRLLQQADILVENFSPRVLDNFGLDWPSLHALVPRLIAVRMPAFGLDGPWRERTGFATTIEQLSGLAWRTGRADDMPLVPRGPCDPLGGMHALFATLLALRHRDRTGDGQLVEVPLVEAGLNAAAEQVIEWSAYRGEVTREGNRSSLAAPQGIYRVRGDDAWIAISVDSDAAWAGLCTVTGRDDWRADAALSSRPGRRAAHDRLDAELSAWLETRDAEPVLEALWRAGVPAAPVVTSTVTGENEQLLARGFFQRIVHPVTGETPYPSFPARFDGRYHAYAGPSPTLGQHTEEVLRELLGTSEAELEGLREAGVIGTRPSFV